MNFVANKTIMACATDDGKEFTTEHFGDAKFYLVYELDLENKELTFLRQIDNTSDEEKTHGDPKKAASISEIMGDIQVIVGFAMGTNVTRMRKNFVPVISRKKRIEGALEEILNLTDPIKLNLEKPKGEDRDIIFIN